MLKMCLDKLEDEYYKELEENCKCDIEEDGCSCLDFDDWLQEKQEEQYA
jgi:hypothetical protein